MESTLKASTMEALEERVQEAVRAGWKFVRSASAPDGEGFVAVVQRASEPPKGGEGGEGGDVLRGLARAIRHR